MRKIEELWIAEIQASIAVKMDRMLQTPPRVMFESYTFPDFWSPFRTLRFTVIGRLQNEIHAQFELH